VAFCNAKSMEYAISGLPPKLLIFFLGSPLEPFLAGIINKVSKF
jgi:hypothetical protein